MNILRKISLIYLAIFLGIFFLKSTGIYTTSILFSQLVSIYNLFIVFIPLLLFLLIKNIKLRSILSVAYSIVLFVLSPALLFTSLMIIDDLGTNNGLRKVHEQNLSSGYLFSIYRTHDEGALGGDELVIYKEKILLPGVVYRTQFQNPTLRIEYNHHTKVEEEGDIIDIPSELELREKAIARRNKIN